MKMSPKLNFAAAVIFVPTLLGGCQATMQGIQSDATNLKQEMFTPDTHAQIAEKTGTTLTAVTAFDTNCKKVGQEVTAERTSPIYQLKDKTFKLGCE